MILIIAYVWAFLISKVDTVYLDLSCPAVFVEGNNKVMCKIKSSYFSSDNCGLVPSDVQFHYTKINDKENSIVLCQTPNARTTNECPSSPVKLAFGSSNSTCFCVQRNGDMFTYELQFQASKTEHAGATLFCQPCQFQEPADVNIMTSCINITFETHLRDVPANSTETHLRDVPANSTEKTAANISSSTHSVILSSPAPVLSASSSASRIGLECAWMAWVIFVSLIGQEFPLRMDLIVIGVILSLSSSSF